HRRNLTTFMSGFARAFAAVGVLESDDVVEVRRGDLEDPQVLYPGHAVDGARPKAERLARHDLDLVDASLVRTAKLEPRTPLEHVPRLVLELVVLEAQRLARLDEQDLARVVLALRPDQLGAPRLLHGTRPKDLLAQLFPRVKPATPDAPRHAPAPGAAPPPGSRSARDPRD